jgi:hypothetical protein
MSIIDKLDKKISEKKKESEDKKKLKSELRNKIYSFEESFYKKNLFKDFIDLEKLFKKHTKKDKDISATLSHNSHFLEVELTFTVPEYSSRAIKISLEDRKHVSYSFSDNELKELKEYKFLETNFCLKVSYLGDWDAEHHSRDEISEKNFELKNKEDAYDYLNELFQKQILLLGALD